jgi:hypothetical protein
MRTRADAAGAGIFVDLAVGAGKGLKTAGKAAAKATKKAVEEANKARRKQTDQALSNISFGDTKKSITKEMNKLIGLFAASAASPDGCFAFEERKEIGSFIVNYLDQGIRLLQSCSDITEKEVEKFQVKVRKTRVANIGLVDLGLKGMGQATLSAISMKDTTSYAQNLAIVDGVYLNGSTKYILKEVKELYGVFNSLYGFPGKAKNVSQDKKLELVNGAYSKINTALEVLKQKADVKPELIAKYQAKLFGYLFSAIKSAFSSFTELRSDGQDIRDTVDSMFAKIDEMLPLVQNISGIKLEERQQQLAAYKTKREGYQTKKEKLAEKFGAVKQNANDRLENLKSSALGKLSDKMGDIKGKLPGGF